MDPARAGQLGLTSAILYTSLQEIGRITHTVGNLCLHMHNKYIDNGVPSWLLGGVLRGKSHTRKSGLTSCAVYPLIFGPPVFKAWDTLIVCGMSDYYLQPTHAPNVVTERKSPNESQDAWKNITPLFNHEENCVRYRDRIRICRSFLAISQTLCEVSADASRNACAVNLRITYTVSLWKM